ncbi:hypothetical protein DLAC_02125 [Tieghemostelium lacteum]|uniref:Peptidase M28 domain-containing protein n=1 Tax=Tieghemostelium lacteum TaxID=361077 RepID=A0A152A463_TIELA|nr:hypothetical protein DLAC_02125 [Tieghemostelium lacteum]|eukprot:KYR01038.1 hypothetical protein DLAC_02125 [Tieghemostelium lacteum]
MNSRFIILVILFISVFSLSRYINEYNIKHYEKSELFEVDIQNVLGHVRKLIDIGNSNEVFEDSRITAREYIRDYLFNNSIPKENVIYNRFEWSDRKADGKLITTTTWTGINIIAWTNSTPVDDQRIRVIGAHYDTLHWGINKTSGAHGNLAAVGMMMETIIEIYKYQQQSSESNQTPYMFVFFDQTEPGSLGSKSFVDYHQIAKNPKKFAYYIDLNAIGYKDSLGAIIQTYPYEHKQQTLFSPVWLVNQMVQSGYQVTEQGIQVGYAHIPGSLIYQAHRYHLHSIPYLSDDGPFTWSGVDSLLLTDLDVFYSTNPDHRQISDQIQNLDPDQLKMVSDMLINFLVSTNSEESIQPNSNTIELSKISNSTLMRFLLHQFENLFDLLFPARKQYLFIGPIALHYFELLSISYLLITIIYYYSFIKYRDINTSIQNALESKSKSKFDDDLLNYQKKHNRGEGNMGSNGSLNSDEVTSDTYLADESDNTPSSAIKNGNSNIKIPFFVGINGHRILFFHLFLLTMTALVDTVYTFELLAISFLGMFAITYEKMNVNVFLGIISSVLSISFVYQDIQQISTLGRKGPNSYQRSISILLLVYILHSLLIAFYGHHYSKKREYQLSLKAKKD